MTLTLKTFAGLMVCFAAVHVVLGCSVEDITSKLTKCLSVSVEDLTTASAETILSAFCSNVECNIKCYIDALGNCYTQDQFFSYDPDIIKVTSRAFCNNQVDTLAAVTNCVWSDSSCLTTLATDISNSVTEYNSGNYAAYKSEYCSALKQALSCIGFTTTATCTAALADGAKSYYEASFSLTSCGIAQHSLASTYSDDVKCGGCQLHQSVAIIVLITIILALLI